jgi:hypothetical protein
MMSCGALSACPGSAGPQAPLASHELPPPWPLGERSFPSKSKRRPTNNIKLGSLVIAYEESGLANTARAIAVGKIQHQGDTGDSMYWLCFTLEGTKGLERVWLLSQLDLSAGITGLRAVSLKDGGPTAGCPLMPANFRPVSLDGAVWLGSTEKAAVGALGTPSFSEGPWRWFAFEERDHSQCQPEGSLQFNWLLYKVEEGAIVAVLTGQSSSC